MNKYIDYDKVLAMEEFFGEHATIDNPMADGCYAVRSDFIMNLPAADVTPVVHAHWIHKDYIQNNMIIGIVGECSNCGKVRLIDNYCPNCGAKMDEETK